MLLALNLGDNCEVGGYKVLAERALEWQGMNSLCLISFVLCKTGIFICLEKYAEKTDSITCLSSFLVQEHHT